MSNVLPFSNTVRPQVELNHNYQPSPRKKKAQLAAATKAQPLAPTSNNENRQLPPKPISYGIGVDALLADILAAEDLEPATPRNQQSEYVPVAMSQLTKERELLRQRIEQLEQQVKTLTLTNKETITKKQHEEFAFQKVLKAERFKFDKTIAKLMSQVQAKTDKIIAQKNMINVLQEQIAALLEAQEEEDGEGEGEKDSKDSGGNDVPSTQKPRSKRRRVKGHRVVRPLTKIHETDEENDEEEEDEDGGNMAEAGDNETEDGKDGPIETSDTDDEDVRQVMDAIDQQMKILEHFKEFQSLQQQQIIMDERQDEEKKKAKKPNATTSGKGGGNETKGVGGKKKATKSGGVSPDGKKKGVKKPFDQPTVTMDGDGIAQETVTDEDPGVEMEFGFTVETTTNEENEGSGGHTAEMETRRQELLSTIQQIENEGNDLIQLANQVDQLLLNQPTKTLTKQPVSSNSTEPSQSLYTISASTTTSVAPGKADETIPAKTTTIAAAAEGGAEESENAIDRLNAKRRETHILSIEDYLKSIESDDVSYDQVLDEILSSVEYLSHSVDGLDEDTNQALSQINTRIVISREGDDGMSSQPSSGAPTAVGKSRKGSKSGKKSKRSSLGSIASTATSNTATTEQMILGTMNMPKDGGSSGKKGTSSSKKVSKSISQEETKSQSSGGVIRGILLEDSSLQLGGRLDHDDD